MYINHNIIYAFALTLASAGSASAVIIGGDVTSYSGDLANSNFVKLSAPFSDSTPANTVGSNTFNTPNLYAFDEDQNIILSGGLSVNVGRNMSAGETIASHYVFFDPQNQRRQSGYVDFDADIIGVATSTTLLSASDFLANNDVTYLNPGLRGLEAGDDVMFSGSRLFVDWYAGAPGDYVRVFTERSPTAAVPLPAAAPLLALAIAGLGFAARRRRA